MALLYVMCNPLSLACEFYISITLVPHQIISFECGECSCHTGVFYVHEATYVFNPYDTLFLVEYGYGLQIVLHTGAEFLPLLHFVSPLFLSKA